MTDKRLLIHTVFLILAPLLVAFLGWSTLAALLLVVLLLLWRWLIVISGFTAPEKTPEAVLETISVSHFVEKVRWCLDRLGVEYAENTVGGTLGAFYLGRTVPALKVRTGAVRSVIGNSAEILRYAWGRYGYAQPEEAEFLRPTVERVALEKRIDQEGAKLQIWVYYRILGERDLTLHAWGANDPATPGWQRTLLKVLFPLQVVLIRRAFKISDESFARAVASIEELLAEMEGRLVDSATSLLGDASPNYVDYAFAAINGAWLMPAGYGGGKADGVRIEYERMPELMQMDVDSWRAAFPNVVSFIERLYRDHRS